MRTGFIGAAFIRETWRFDENVFQHSRTPHRFAVQHSRPQRPFFLTPPMCTGVIDRRLINKAAQLKISHYLMKPFSPETLLDKVDKLLPQRSGRTVTIS